MERKAPERPDFTPDLLTILDYVNRWIRRRFFGTIAEHRGWRFLLVASMLLAYYYPY